jgi:hypothetical protein
VVIDGEFSDAPNINHEQRGTAELLAPRPAASTQPAIGAADEIPTAAEYHTSWNTIILGATNPDQLAKTWNEQTELRKKIAWTDEHPFNPLQARVRKAVDSMRAPA